jgi:transposase InsO family protein
MARRDWDVVDVRLAALEAKWSGMELGRVLTTFRCSRSQLFQWQARYRAEGVAGLEPRSRRPLTCPRQTPLVVEDAVLVIAKARPRWGPDKIRAELVRTSGAAPARSTIQQILTRRTGSPRRRVRDRAKPAWRRFVRPHSNDLWQIDATRHALVDGTGFWVVDVLDDHSRFLLAATVGAGPTAELAWSALQGAVAVYGLPRQLLSDNGTTFTGRLLGTEVSFERSARAAGIELIHAGPGHPQTLGKLERQHRTQNEWVTDHRPTSAAQAQQVLDAYRADYNQHRPHRALDGQRPGEVYHPDPGLTLPALDLPEPAAPLPAGCRRRKVNINGFIGYQRRSFLVGRRYAGMTVGVDHRGHELTIYYGHSALDTYIVTGLTPAKR